MKFGKIIAGACMALGVFISLGTPAQAKDKVKVGVVYVTPIGEHGYSYQHHQGILAAKAKFGDKMELKIVENVQEGPDAERVIRQLAQQGSDIIFTTSFGYMNPTIKVAKRFPKVAFAHATGFKNAKNVSTYNIRFHEGRYVAGQMAGKMTKSNTIGYVASFPIPEVIAGINAAYLGAKSVNPDVKFKIVWVSSWFDPGKEADATKALRDQGADVLFQHTDSPAPMKIAEQEGVKAVGQASDMIKVGPNAQMTAIVNTWTPYYIDQIQAVLDGKWKMSKVWGGFGMDMLKMPINDNIPADVKAAALKTMEDIRSGKLNPFTGPVNKQDGSVYLKAGEVAEDGTVAGMNFYVEGIDGSLPN